MSKIIWIDLGTTNSAVAFMEGWEAKIIPNAEGNRTTPSIVAKNKNGEIIVGTSAKRQAITNSENTIYSAKRFIWRKYNEVKDEAKKMWYEIKKWKNGEALIVFDGKDVRPEEISSYVLWKLKEDAEKFLGTKVSKAVITVPAYFNDEQRQATINAGKIAGLEVERIINEPTAAALAYGAGKNKNETIAVYDLGGGTFDVSILDISEEGTFEVLATNGDTQLWGDNFDELILDYILDEFHKEQGIDLRNDKMALQRVRDEAEKAKKELSSTQSYDVNLPYITVDSTGPKNLLINVSRTKFEELISDMVEKTIEPCKKVLKDAWLKTSDINTVLLVGWSTRIPLVQQKVEAFFGKKPSSNINPDEAVALGAAVQGGIIGGDVQDILLLDVTPLTLGIETMGGIRTAMIPRNTTIPYSKSEVFSTAVDNQPSVEIHVVQWEREMAADNKSLWRFMLDGITPAPRWVPQIEVTFDIDANGVLNVTATDKATGKNQKVTIQGASGLSDEEVDKLVKDAENHKKEDQEKKEKIEIKNKGDSAISQANKFITDNDWKISEDDKTSLKENISALEEVLKTDDTNDIKVKTEELTQKLMQIWQAMYANEANEQESQSNQTTDNNDDIEDAEVEK